ncbi:MAG: hypothetical protein AB7I19_00160 [Planctomycetota bacterium]
MEPDRSPTYQPALRGLVFGLAALASVSYAAIAVHRRERTTMGVLAAVASAVAASFHVQIIPFYARF